MGLQLGPTPHSYNSRPKVGRGLLLMMGMDSTTRTLKLIESEYGVTQYEVMDTAVAHWDSSKKCVTMVWGNGELWTKKPKVQG